ncbi:MAG TPA: PEP-CTERM sorting domain-containing protein [Candidatus Saccharimonadales bacterium]|nr:PEP-CTERM sorting domain-containing protein [Candidatus Saccharimonadales bacterium]
MKRVVTLLLAVVALAAVGAGSASAAAPLTLGTGWTKFYWDATGETDPAGGYQVTSADVFTIKMTDSYVVGDAFDLYDGGSLVLSTPSVPKTGVDVIDDDADAAYASPLYSHGYVTLLPGTHNLTINIRERALDGTGAVISGGGAFIRADAGTIPEPHSLLLLGMGLAGGALALRRRSA